MKWLFKSLFIFFLFFFCSNIFAADLSFDLDSNTIKTGDTFTNILFLDTEGQSINTLEGEIKYNENFLTLEKINIGNSFVSFWVEKPYNKTSGSVHFSGIIPGGISSNKNEVFSLIFRAQKEGNTSLLLSNVNFYLNDGVGTKAPTKSSNANIAIIKGVGSSDATPKVAEDKIPPESFTVVRTHDQSIYDNRYFVVFNTLDKDSGIDYYEVCEFFICFIAESPFMLKNQTQFYYIAVKAYDTNGNLQISRLISPWLILLDILIFLFILYLFRRYLHFYRV